MKPADRAAETRLLAAASHDLRQPLHAMELLVAALSGKPLDAEAEVIVADLQASLASARRMLSALLEVAELDAGSVAADIQDLPLGPLLDRLRARHGDLARERGLELRVVASSRAVRSDPLRLETILDHLIANALRFTDRGRVLVGVRRAGERLRLEVWDSGPGIPESGQDAVFDDFCQLDGSAKERGAGLGLGLGLVRRLAALLGHRVGLRSEPGRGSVFWIELDAAPDTAEAPPRDSGEGEGACVLIVADDTMTLDAMSRLLEAWGYRAVALPSAEAARTVETLPDLVIAEAHLPGGESGATTIRALAERAGRAVPGILMTSEAGARDGPAENGFHVMRKPLRPAKLRALLRHLLAER